jgi:hypothetical protein
MSLPAPLSHYRQLPHVQQISVWQTVVTFLLFQPSPLREENLWPLGVLEITSVCIPEPSLPLI